MCGGEIKFQDCQNNHINLKVTENVAVEWQSTLIVWSKRKLVIKKQNAGNVYFTPYFIFFSKIKERKRLT